MGKTKRTIIAILIAIMLIGTQMTTSISESAELGETEMAKTTDRLNIDGEDYEVMDSDSRKQLTDAKSALKTMNDGGNVDFYFGNSGFYNGYYSGTTYNGDGEPATPNPSTGIFGDWKVLLVHVIKGKTITISGMPTAVGAQSVWLNSNSLTDVKQVAWNAQQCNGTHVCESDWLAMSGFKMDPAAISIKYGMLNDLEGQNSKIWSEIYKNEESVLCGFIRQYINPSEAISGKYYVHNGNGTSSSENTYIISPIRVYAGIGYSFVNVYGYFCTIIYDDGTKQVLTEDTSVKKTINVPALSQDGWAYVTVWHNNINNAMVVAGDANYDGLYFAGYGINADTSPTADMVVQNKTIAVSKNGSVTPWVNQDYTISGNAIEYVAPASGNSGFYITPETRENISKIRVNVDVNSSGGGTMALHVWDTTGANFADHLYTVGTFSASKIYDIDLDYVASQRPSMDMSKWVILISNSGNAFTFSFNIISILSDSGVPDALNKKTIGEIVKIFEERLSSEPLYIECGPGKQYTRLRDAIEAAETVRGSTVVVYPGVYDLTIEFASEISAASGNTGIKLANDVYVKFLSGSYVKALFPESSAWISNQFQPFYADGRGFTLDGLNIEASNCRYCVHDERVGADVKYHNVYKNCKMKFTMDDPSVSGGTSYYMQCIGGGLGKYGYIEIDGGYYETVNNLYPNSQQPISYHNGVTAGCDSKIFIKDVYLANKGIIRLGCYGESTIKTPVYVCGCSMYDQVYKMYEVPSEYQNDNFEVIEWNNEIRGE